jgi:methionine aminopeptidase
MSRASTVPNDLALIAPAIEGGTSRRFIVLRALAASHKVGEFSMTRKPFVFPYKKRKRLK